MKKLLKYVLVGLMLVLVADMALFGVSVYTYLKAKPTKINGIVRLVQGGRTFCSGTVINETTIVTAAHCIVIDTPFGAYMNTAPIEIRGEDNQPLGVTAKPAMASTQMDQAILKGKFTGFQAVGIITDPEELTSVRKVNNQLVSCGYPLGQALFCTTNKYVRAMNFMYGLTGVLIPGMSGGPTLLDGKVVAVNSAVYEDLLLVSPTYFTDRLVK